MSYVNKYNEWVAGCMNVLFNEMTANNQKIAAALKIVGAELRKRKKKQSKKKYWHEPILQKRLKRDFFNETIPALCLEDLRFENYFRLSATQFEKLLFLVGPMLTRMTESAEVAEMHLALTLRFLAAGDSLITLSERYLIALNDISEIIEETCEVLWAILSKRFMPHPVRRHDWLDIANNFEQCCNFKHCIGAIDAKHVTLQCPDSNYSSSFKCKNSIILLAICDANYLFTFVEIGTFESSNTGTMFKNSKVAKKFQNRQLNVPEPQPILPGRPSISYYLVGDEAFPLTDYLIQPYSSKTGINQHHTVFNKRLNRARESIENCLGILVSQWRILRKPIACSTNEAVKFTQALVCLHNFLRKQDIEEGESQYVPDNMVDRYDQNGMIQGTWRSIMEDNTAFKDITHCGFKINSRNTFEIRNELCRYYNNEGVISV